MTEIFTHWPLAFVCAAMIVAAVIDGWKLKVPNWLTFPLVLEWLAARRRCTTLDSYRLDGHGRYRREPGLHVLGMALLYPVYLIGGMGSRRREDADGLRRLGRRILQLPAACKSS